MFATTLSLSLSLYIYICFSFQEMAAWLATYGFCAFVSLEQPGQFGPLSSYDNALGLADRGLQMWRKIRDESPLILRRLLSGNVAYTGYSMGGAAAVYTATQSRVSDNVKFVAPLHALVRI